MKLFVRGRHAKGPLVSMFRWIQLTVGISLTFAGLVTMLAVGEGSKAGDKDAPLVFGLGGLMALIGIVMLIALLRWASGRK